MEADKTTSELIFFVNGKMVVEPEPMPEWTLLSYLRNKLRLYGAKEACGEGGCGSCTVMLSRIQGQNGEILNCAVNACLTPLCSVHGAAIVTVEGIGSLVNGIHPIQERIAKSHGSQCGFCTPGFVMSMYTLLRNNEHPTEMEMEDSFQGNLCRCTGYRPILEGFKTFCKSDNCCQKIQPVANSNECTRKDDLVSKGSNNNMSQENAHLKNVGDLLFDASQFKPYDPSQDPIFPPELQINHIKFNNSLKFRSKQVTWHRPATLKQLLDLKAMHPEAKLVGGNTENRYEIMQLNRFSPVYIQIADFIQEMNEIQLNDSYLVVGGRVTFTRLRSFCMKQMQMSMSVQENQQQKLKNERLLFSAIIQLLSRLGDVQTRNVATIGGSIPSGAITSDSNTFFTAAGCVVVLKSRDRGSREVRMDEQFFKVGGGTNIETDEVITTLKIPVLSENEFIWTTKTSRRKDTDAAILNCAIKIIFHPTSNTVQGATTVFNGLSLNGLQIDRSISGYLINKPWASTTIENWLKHAAEAFEGRCCLDPNISNAYRQPLVTGSLYRFSQAVLKWRGDVAVNFDITAYHSHHDKRKATQMYEIVSEEQPLEDLIGRPIVHLSAMKQAAGEAVFVNDIPPFSNELFGSFVLSEIACARIKSVNYSDAMKHDGVLEIFDSKSLPGERNHYGCLVKDDVVFAENQVDFFGQPIAFVVATTEAIAKEAVKHVQIEYEETTPAILTINDAIAAKAFFDHGHGELTSGDADEGFGQSDVILEGDFRIGGQKHFYMEPSGSTAYPTREDGEIAVILTTHSLTNAQETIAHCLGLQSNKVIVKSRRIGGGFGGKETRVAFLGVAVSLAAQKLGRPVRCILSRSEDMQLVGGRHPVLCRYKVGFSKAGHINAIKADIFGDAGSSTDYSPFVMNQLLQKLTSAYKIPNWNLQTFLCRTNTQSKTAFRGFGGPQGALIAEHIMDVVAENLGKRSFELRPMHFYKTGDTTPFGHLIDHCTIQRCWDECWGNSNFSSRFQEIEKFNSESRYIKRGISLVPVSFGIGFPVPFLNQGGSLVMIYKDGSVSLNHGGCEMGQGLHTKMMQIASRALGIPIDKIHVAETSTDKVPNTSPSAGSMTADLNGPAVIDACETLVKRLQKYRESNPDGTWEDWVTAAYFDRTNLSTTGFNKLEFPGLCNYMSYGAGCSEVEIDCLTGEHKIIRTDIVMDVGESLNPAIDVGQIEGAFMQGCGLVTLEDVVFSPEGKLLSTGPSSYKIPSVSSIPKEFNVSLLRGAPNPKAVYSSKAIGEPPMLASSSVFLAIKEAVRAMRKDAQFPMSFQFDSPATAEKIQLACGELKISFDATTL